MTVVVEPPPSRARTRQAPTAGPDALVLGLVNNMPYSALEGTETQFLGLLQAAAGRHQIRLRFAALPEVPRGPGAKERIASAYWTIDQLTGAAVDALIVTGTEPRAVSLRDEPYWSRMIDVLDFADSSTLSSVWSCLAAHAAVLAIDGVERRRRPDKLCGVFGHQLRAGHALATGLMAPHPVPHSRWNDLPIEQLKAADYTVVAESVETGADTFVKFQRSMLVFLQGHPEYEERTLLKEYQRDVQRFISGQQPHYPSLPVGYFAPRAIELLQAFEQDLKAGRFPDPVAAFPFTAVAATLSSSWRPAAARLYSNWLDYVAERKAAAGSQNRYAL
jgi:homoserine O-succinyltransferase